MGDTKRTIKTGMQSFSKKTSILFQIPNYSHFSKNCKINCTNIYSILSKYCDIKGNKRRNLETITSFGICNVRSVDLQKVVIVRESMLS